MSDVQVFTKFELLPNEILIECFEYLNAIYIFYAFDFLNYRYYNLIRNISLHFNFQHVQESTFDQFCQQILLNPEIKTQICSLELLNEDVYDQISTFFSRFSFNQFPHLRSICLNVVNDYYPQDWVWMLPLLFNLHHFYFKDSLNEIHKILAAVATSTIQALSIPILKDNLEFIDGFTSVVNLTISRQCTMQEMCQFIKYFPKLKYLTVNSLNKYANWRPANYFVPIDEHAAIHLKQLIINYSIIEFGLLEILMRKTPNLRSLTIFAENFEMIDACRWQLLIQSSLPLLTIFKFKFHVRHRFEDNDIYNRFQHFQSDFWQEHHWYIECTIAKDCACIYTIPYLSNEYTLKSYTKRYYNISNINLDAFNQVTVLTLHMESITDTCKHYFSCVKTLILEDKPDYESYTYLHLKTKHIESLKMIVNLYNLKHLDISWWSCKIEYPLVLLTLMKEAPNLSSLKIDKDTLFSLLSNREICEYMSKMIPELDVAAFGRNTFSNLYEIMRFCKKFSNIEQLRCNCGGSNNLLLIVNELAKLSKMKVFSFRTRFSKQMNKWLEDHASELNIYSFKIKCETYDYTDDDNSDLYQSGYDTPDYFDVYYNEYYYDCFDVDVYEYRAGKQSRVLLKE